MINKMQDLYFSLHPVNHVNPIQSSSPRLFVWF